MPTTHPTTANVPVPTRQSIRDTCQMLLGCEVKVGNGDRVVLGLDSGTITVATMIDDAHRVAALLVADLPLAVRAGTCLELSPAGEANEMVANHALTHIVQENFQEVLNVLSAVFNTSGAPHVRLGPVYTDTDAMPPLVLVALNSLTRRDDLRVNITGYGHGHLSVILID